MEYNFPGEQPEPTIGWGRGGVFLLEDFEMVWNAISCILRPIIQLLVIPFFAIFLDEDLLNKTATLKPSLTRCFLC